MDSCRVWESHAEPIAIDNWCPELSVQSADATQAPSGDRQFGPIAIQGRKRDADGEGITPEGKPQFGRYRAPHTKRARGRGSRRNVMSQRLRNRESELWLRDMPLVGSVAKGKTSPPASQPAGGLPPLSGGPWPVFLLWIPWTWGEPMFKIGQIFSI